MTAPSEGQVLVVDRQWRAGGCDRRCRFPGCGGPAVARLNRGRLVKGDGTSKTKVPAWWHYCADHLYGRQISEDGQTVLYQVAAGSPAAERGWIE